jgi:hypothetical protein
LLKSMTGRICLGRNLAKKDNPSFGRSPLEGNTTKGNTKRTCEKGNIGRELDRGIRRETRQREYSRGYYKGDRAPARGFC